jgi:hypothetical protein
LCRSLRRLCPLQPISPFHFLLCPSGVMPCGDRG